MNTTSNFYNVTNKSTEDTTLIQGALDPLSNILSSRHNDSLFNKHESKIQGFQDEQ